jgi:hypothetical protein
VNRLLGGQPPAGHCDPSLGDHDGRGDACDACPRDRGDDADYDGVGDPCDLCPNTMLAISVDATGCASPAAPADFDRDGDVDQSDFGHLQGCLSAPGVGQMAPGCSDADLNMDGDADSNDVVIFLRCLSGANTLGDLNCSQ